ncbi:MAG: hypothetical protein IPK76_11270 [Lewinellaceae bacterium]|jgi:hypothetical protein|nr:hypothetical protein [Lewinellaceae bacterium]
MKTISVKSLSRKYGRKALIIYLIFCALKGVFFLFAGERLLRYFAPPKGDSGSIPQARAMTSVDADQLVQSFGSGNTFLVLMTLLACGAVVYGIFWIRKMDRRDYDTGRGNLFLEEIDKELFR